MRELIWVEMVLLALELNEDIFVGIDWENAQDIVTATPIICLIKSVKE